MMVGKGKKTIDLYIRKNICVKIRKKCSHHSPVSAAGCMVIHCCVQNCLLPPHGLWLPVGGQTITHLLCNPQSCQFYAGPRTRGDSRIGLLTKWCLKCLCKATRGFPIGESQRGTSGLGAKQHHPLQVTVLFRCHWVCTCV